MLLLKPHPHTFSIQLCILCDDQQLLRFKQALQHKLALEGNRVGELEGLLSGMRTSQFKSSFSEQHSTDKAGSLQARNTLLTQQVHPSC